VVTAVGIAPSSLHPAAPDFFVVYFNRSVSGIPNDGLYRNRFRALWRSTASGRCADSARFFKSLSKFFLNMIADWPGNLKSLNRIARGVFFPPFYFSLRRDVIYQHVNLGIRLRFRL
jgi:hypothetical protein